MIIVGKHFLSVVKETVKMIAFSTRRCTIRAFCSMLLLLTASVCPLAGVSSGEGTWTWTTETVDQAGEFTSLAADKDGNLHVSYSTGTGAIKYAFRQAETGKWFTRVVDSGEAYTDLALDSQGNPHICYPFRVMKYANWDGKTWKVQTIATDTARIAFSCAVEVSPDGVPHLIWYRDQNADNSLFTHLKYAELKDGVWAVRTVDWDTQTGKFESMTLDSHGNPVLSYDAWVKGELKFARWDGNAWDIRTVDDRGRAGNSYNIGMGNSIALDSHDQALMSYEERNVLKLARQQGSRWAIEKVDTINTLGGWVGFRTSLALDRQGFPHIAYDDAGTLKHAFWDGQKWHIEVI